MGERLIDLPDAPERQPVVPTYDSRDVLMVDLMRSEGCPIEDIVILEGAQLTATKVVGVNPVSSIPSVK